MYTRLSRIVNLTMDKMAAPMEDDVKTGEMDLGTHFCTIEATVPTGFETVAKGEVKEKIGTECKELRGRIKFQCPLESVEQVVELGCVDNCRVVMLYESNFKFTDDKVENMQRLRDLVGSVSWPKGVQIWKRFFSFEHPVAEVPEVITSDFGEPYFPPPRQGAGTGKKTRKSKGKKWKKKKDLTENANGGTGGQREETGSEKMSVSEQGEGTGQDKTKNSAVTTDENKTSANNMTEEKLKQTELVGSVKDSEHTGNTCEQEEGNESQAKKPRVRENPWDPLKPSFRVTCNRAGDKHNFDSMTAAANFGGAVWRYFGWNVKMTEFDIEVILGIDDQELTVSIGLTKESLHRRNITHFGPTTLRPTIAYGMLRLCEIQTGDVVCDPMCGSGSIPIQSSLSWPLSYNICGEIGSRAIGRTRDNIDDLALSRKAENKRAVSADAIRWDTCNLPLKDHSVDVFITDLPFGVRMGHKVDNWRLYPGALLEMARVVKPESGRCCLLTEDKKCIIKTLQKIGKYWNRTRTLGVNIGGLAAGVYVLARTAMPFDKGENREFFAARGTKGDKCNKSDGSGEEN